MANHSSDTIFKLFIFTIFFGVDPFNMMSAKRQ